MLAATCEEQFEWPMEGHVTRSEQTKLISEKFSFFSEHPSVSFIHEYEDGSCQTHKWCMRSTPGLISYISFSMIVTQRVTQASCEAAKSILTFPLLQHGLLLPAAPRSSLPPTSLLLHAAPVAKIKAGAAAASFIKLKQLSVDHRYW